MPSGAVPVSGRVLLSSLRMAPVVAMLRISPEPPVRLTGAPPAVRVPVTPVLFHVPTRHESTLGVAVGAIVGVY
ncbi:MAG: hypothetical protein NVS3B18_09780 [Candidatus Dormibacteria bacterium]